MRFIFCSFKGFFTLLVSLTATFVFAQTKVSGTVSDAKSRKLLSNVRVSANNNVANAVLTKAGKFEISSDSTIQQLTFSKENYDDFSLPIDPQNPNNLSVQLSPINVQDIQEVVLQSGIKKYKNKKENPAYAIMKEVFKRKRTNGLSKYKTYQFDEYEKIELDITNIDSAFAKKKLFNKIEFVFDYADSLADGKMELPVYFTEAVYKNYGVNEPDHKVKRQITAQKTSGFKDNQMITMTSKNFFREINLYDNTLNYFDMGFQSPAGSDGFGTYNYELVDTLNVRGNEVYKIIFEPKNKEILAFQGTLLISKEHYAVVEASLKSTKKMNLNFVNGISTILEFDNPDDDTFLPIKNTTAITLSVFNKNKDAKGMLSTRTVSYSNYAFDQPINPDVFETKEEDVNDDLLQKNDQYWDSARTDSLSQSEKGIYEMIDKLEDTPKFNRLIKLSEIMVSGYWNVGKAIDIGSLFSIYGYNEIEGSRIRLGARTYFTRNDDWRIQGYTAYGFKDQKIKYGIEGKYMFNKINRFTLGFGSRRDILQLGVQLTNDDGIMSRTFASSAVFGRGENASLSNVMQNNFFASVDPWKNITLRLDGSLQSIKSADTNFFNLHYYKNGELRQTVNDSHLSFSIVARPGAKFSQTGVDRAEHYSLAPTFILKYSRGVEGLFNADFNYNKVQILYYQPILLGSWGKTFLNFEAGKNFDTVPLALQNVIPGNQSYGLVPNTFSQLNYYEFVTDQYLTMHAEHHFNGKLLAQIPLIKKLKLREVGFFRAAYGTLSDESKAINVEGFRYSAPSERIYYEYGFGIENIGFGNFRIFRVDFNWRGNYLNRPDVSKFGIKAGFQFTF